MSGQIAPVFYPVHRAIREHQYTHFNLSGGRGSTKSSFVSLEVPVIIKRNPVAHALVLRKVGETLRDSVFAQYKWGISQLGLDAEFRATVSPMEITYLPTGQKILFRGADKPEKIKSIKVPFGYIAVTHFEELDQFSGRDEVRLILESTMRGGGDLFWNFETFNPPVSANNWANKYAMETRADRLLHKSCYTDVPRAWLGERFFIEAEELQRTNERAYRHEYLGEATGTGGNVFENVVLRDIPEKERRGFDRIYNGGDWGYFHDPFAFNRMHYDAARRRLYIFAELHMLRAGNRVTYEAVRALGVTPEELVTMDSAEPKSVADYREYGLFARGAEKGPGSVDYSMKWLAGLNAIIIDPAVCPKTALEFTTYEFERTKTGEFISGYPDRDNHHIDAVRYAMSPVWKRRGL